MFRDLGIGADTQGDEYQFAYTLPSQSQVEDSFSKLIIKETNENNNLEDRELQFEVHWSTNKQKVFFNFQKSLPLKRRGS